MAVAINDREVVLIGAGHAHMEVLRRLRPAVGARTVVVDPEDFWYSGLATGMLGGSYPIERDRIDVARQARRIGARVIHDRAVAIDPEARTVRLEGGAHLAFGVASVDVGSRVPTERVAGMAEHAFPVKPIRRLAQLHADLSRRFRGSRGDPIRILVIGGGPTASEVAANIMALARRAAANVELTIAASGDRLIPEAPEPASRCLEEALRAVGVAIRHRCRIERMEPGAARSSDADRLGFDVAIAAIGLVPNAIGADPPLPTSSGGGLLVDDSLRSVAAPAVFASGDCAAVEGMELPMIGVVAVRQAGVLAHNIEATLRGRPLRRYRPQRRYLLILNLGDGSGLALRGSCWYRGRAALWLKDRLDRGFLRRLS